MILQKWNYETHKYEPFESPAEVVLLYSDDMSARVDCANCGTEMHMGDSYTSRTIHNHIGLGFPVCGDCYEAEAALEEASKK